MGNRKCPNSPFLCYGTFSIARRLRTLPLFCHSRKTMTALCAVILSQVLGRTQFSTTRGNIISNLAPFPGWEKQFSSP